MTFFNKIDEAITSQLDQLLEKPQLSNLVDQYNLLSEKSQLITKGIALILAIFIPLTLPLVLMSINSSIKNEITTKNELTLIAEQLINDKAGIKTKSRLYFSTKEASSSQISQSINSIASGLGVDKTHIKTKVQEPSYPTDTISEAIVDLSFTNLSNDHLFRFLAQVINKEKVKLSSIEITNNEKSGLLDGKAELIWSSKAAQ